MVKTNLFNTVLWTGIDTVITADTQIRINHMGVLEYTCNGIHRTLALAFTAFLSVFREGAEVVLFYQPMLMEGNAGMVWAGFAVGCVVLVFVYLAITKLSIKLPIKIFFTATSILMAVMCVSFLGSGIKELAEGNVFDLVMRVPGIPENDVIQIFGIYPYLETLLPQLILAVILLITFLVAHYRGKMDALRRELTEQTGR